VPSDAPYELVTSIMSTSDAFLRESQRLFRPHGLTAAQFNVLNVLAEQPAGISQRELGNLLVVDHSNVTGLIDRIERAGWVRRADHPTDRRVYQIFITRAGHRLWASVLPLYLAVIRQVTNSLTARQMRATVDLLRSLEAAAGKWVLPGK
jgi:DNA-binding MarR family transcriptional regulator